MIAGLDLAECTDGKSKVERIAGLHVHRRGVELQPLGGRLGSNLKPLIGWAVVGEGELSRLVGVRRQRDLHA
jgi:hypothetical protein